MNDLTDDNSNIQNYYSNMLLNGVENHKDITIQDIPLIINTVDVSYPLAFIDYEEDDVLGVNYTSDDGTERFVVINKKYIVDVEILYQQDISIVEKEEVTDKKDVMYQ